MGRHHVRELTDEPFCNKRKPFGPIQLPFCIYEAKANFLRTIMLTHGKVTEISEADPNE